MTDAPAPSWELLGYRTWRYAGQDSNRFTPATYGVRYAVTKVVPMRIERRQMRLP